MTTAFSGTSSERNTTISSRKLSSSTSADEDGSRACRRSLTSSNAAVMPPTWAATPVPAVAAGSVVVAQAVDEVDGRLVLRRGRRERPASRGVAVPG